MLKRVGLLALPLGLIACQSKSEASKPMIKLQDRPGATAWGGLSWGASAEDVKALYPSVISYTGTDTAIRDLDVAGTRMNADLDFENDRLVGVDLVQVGTCEPFVHLAELLVGRYGPPDLSDGQHKTWITKNSWVHLDCGEGVLSLRYDDRVVVDRQVKTHREKQAAEAKEQSRGL